MAFDINEFNNIRDKILDIIVDEDGIIGESHFANQPSFENTPAAVVDVSDTEGLFHSNVKDRIIFVFQIRLYVDLPAGEPTREVEERMGKAYWRLINIFSNRSVLNPEIDIVEPLPSVWEYEEREGGIYRVSEMNLRCWKHISNLGISEES